MSARVKFGPGKYKTMDGQNAVVVAVVKGFAIGYLGSNPRAVMSWSAKTGHLRLEILTHLDLVDPNDKQKKKKPIKAKLWAIVERGTNHEFVVHARHESRQDAIQVMSRACIAIVPISIDCMEGDGLDGSSDGE